jgi:glycosyltransferase involved in cell wall biosynthesis
LKRILWIKTSPLHPLTRGGDLRTYNLLRWLAKWHEVTFVGMTADDGQVEAAKLAEEYSERAHWTHEPKVSQKLGRGPFLAGAVKNLISPLPYAVERFTSSSWQSLIDRVMRETEFDVVVCDFIFPASSLPWGLKKPGTPWVVFQHNVESMIWGRRASEAGTLAKPYFQSQWRRMKRFEAEMCRRFDAVLTVSDDDSNMSHKLYGLENVAGSVPTGVDLDFFSEVPRQLSADPTVVFLGSMDWYANVDAVKQFSEEVWPRIRADFPSAVFRVVGRNPPEDIRTLADAGDGIEVTGTVADVRPYLRRAHLMVVPLRIGGGTRLKIFESMAAEVPVVSTRIGAEGLEVKDGEHLLLAENPDEFASAVCRLLADPELASQMAARARKEIAENHSWERAARVMESLINNTSA